MAWCPNCGNGYREDAGVCGWCGAALHPGDMPVETAQARPGLARLCRLRTNDQIALVTAILEGADIPFLAQDPGGGQFVRILTGGNAFGQDILVREEQYAQALELLDAYYKAGSAACIFEDDPEALEQARAELERDAPSQSWKLLPLLLLGLLAFFVLLALAVR